MTNPRRDAAGPGEPHPAQGPTPPRLPLFTRVLPRFVGEFVVIVVGVLVALAVDGFRERRAEKQRLDAALTGLAEEIHRQHYTFGRITRFNLPEKVAALERVIGFLQEEGAPVQDTVLLLNDLVDSAGEIRLWLSTSRYDALIATGEVRLLAEYPELARWITGIYAGPGTLNPQVAALRGEWSARIVEVLPMGIGRRYVPLAGYNYGGDGPYAYEPDFDDEALGRMVRGLRARRAELLPLAVGEMNATLANGHVLSRTRQDFDRLLHMLQPWYDDDLTDFELGVTAMPDRDRDGFSRPDEVPGPERGENYAQGRWTGTADLNR